MKLEGNLLEMILDHVAERIAAKLAERPGACAPRYADANNNPLGSARAFLDAARRRDFPSFKRARNVVALWADVERYIESRQRPARVPANDLHDDRALLEAAGVRLRGGRGRR